MKPDERLQEAKRLLTRLTGLLRAEGEMNFIRGINSALASLEDDDAERGYAEARRIYRHMAVGRGPFSDYYINGRTGRNNFRRTNGWTTSARNCGGCLIRSL